MMTGYARRAGRSVAMIAWFLLAAAPAASAVDMPAATARATVTPAVGDELRKVLEAVPEAVARDRPFALDLPQPAADWLGRLGTAREVDVALLVLLSYGLPEQEAAGGKGTSVASALAFLAAEVAAGGASTGRKGEHVYDRGGPRQSAGPPRAERSARAARALAWGNRIGLCDAVFVDALRSLPPPATMAEPDLRPVVRDLGMLAYTQGICTLDPGTNPPPK